MRIEVIAPAHQDDPRQPVAGGCLQVLDEGVGRNVRCARRMPDQIDAIGIASVGSGIVFDPFHDLPDVLRAGGPRRRWSEPIGAVDGEKSLARKIGGDVGIDLWADVAIAANIGAPVQIDDDGDAAFALSLENIDAMACVRAVGNILGDLDAAGLRRGENWRVDFERLGNIARNVLAPAGT